MLLVDFCVYLWSNKSVKTMPDNKKPDTVIEIKRIDVIKNDPDKPKHKMSGLLKLGAVFLVSGLVLLVPGIMGLVHILFPLILLFLCFMTVFLDAVKERPPRGGSSPIYPPPGFFGD